MNEGDQNNIDTNSSEIKHVTTSLTTTALPASTSNTLNLKSSIKSSSATVPHSPTITASRHKDEEKKIQMIIFDINVHIAVFRDLLIHVGTTKDAPELREKIRRVRMQCVEGCQQTNNQLLPQVKSALAEGTILDNHQLICLYMLSQLLERELDKCLRLVVAIPMDMSTLYDNRPTTNALSSLFSQVIMGKSVRPDFNAEETLSVQKDKREIRRIIQEMAEYLPQEDPEKARNGLTSVDSKRKWALKKKHKRRRGGGCMMNQVSTSFCCLCTPNNVS